MKLTITLTPTDGTLIITDLDGPSVGSIDFSHYRDLDDVLLISLDKILKKNRLNLMSLTRFHIDSQLGPDSTPVKVAQAVIQGLQVM